MTVRLVLDASAILAYTKESVHVGELVSELYEERFVSFSLPIVSLTQAAARTDSVDRLTVLARHELAMVSPVGSSGWPELVDLSRSFGDCQNAIAFRDTTHIDGCYLVTAEPERYPDLDLIIDVSHD